jgi:hypothetical protein
LFSYFSTSYLLMYCRHAVFQKVCQYKLTYHS